jgi:uncharacterized phiE125 gp8 family phage protein
MGLQLIAAPASEPVSLAEAKEHLRVDHGEEDALILRLIKSAREMAESLTGRAFITQSWKLWRDGWPRTRVIAIPKPPLAAVTSVTAVSRSGTESVLSSDAYIVDSASVPGRVVFKFTASLPIDLAGINSVSVAFQAGYGTTGASIPAAIRNAMVDLIAHLYESRGHAPVEPPAAVFAQLAPFRVSLL